MIMLNLLQIVVFELSKGHVIIHILPEISCNGLQSENVTELMESTRQLMQKEYERLNTETCPKHQKSD